MKNQSFDCQNLCLQLQGVVVTYGGIYKQYKYYICILKIGQEVFIKYSLTKEKCKFMSAIITVPKIQKIVLKAVKYTT